MQPADLATPRRARPATASRAPSARTAAADWSLWIFLDPLRRLRLFAEFVANDRPLLIRFDGRWYVPVLQDYSEDAFGADFLPTDADYTDPDSQAPSTPRAG